jgi:hypothetical protein
MMYYRSIQQFPCAEVQLNTLPRGYVWRCIKDPAGMFYGNYFRWTDIQPFPKSDVEYWTEGTAFCHIETGTILVVRGKRLVKEVYENQTRTLQKLNNTVSNAA